MTAVKCTIQRLPHASCHLPPGFASVAAVSNGDFHGFWPESSNCLNFFFGVPNRPEQTRPESRVARPNWTAGCPFFGQHDQVARFVYPSVPKVTKGQTMMPRLLSLYRSLFLSCCSLSFSVFLSLCLLAGAFASVLVANQKSKSLLALATKRDAVGNADDDLLPLHAPCRMAFRRLYKLGQSTK